MTLSSKLAGGFAAGVAVAVGMWLWLHSSQTSPGDRSPTVSETAASKTQPFGTHHPGPAVVVAPAAKFEPVGADKLEALVPAVRVIVDEREMMLDRMAACRLSNLTNLDRGNLEALCAFLVQKSSLDSDQNGQALKNELMDSLTALEPPPARLREALIQIYRDKESDEAIRDYAVQHLVAYYERLATGAGSAAKLGGQDQVRSVLWEALQETDTSIAGTALVGLARLAGSGHGEFDQEEVGAAALKLARQPDASELVHISALQVCASLRVKEALPLLMQTVRESENTPLRISAIGALGVMAGGNAEVRTLLEEVQQAGDARLQPPIRLALKRIAQAEQSAVQVR